MMDLQQFLDTVPTKISYKEETLKIRQYRCPFYTEVGLNAWAEHDALHYLFNRPFTIEGEEHVAYLERKFQRGWVMIGERYNTATPVPYEFDEITPEMIDETASIIYQIYNSHTSI